MIKKLLLSGLFVSITCFSNLHADQGVSNLPVSKTGTAAASGTYNSVAISMAVVGVGLAVGTAIVFSLVNSHYGE